MKPKLAVGRAVRWTGCPRQAVLALLMALAAPVFAQTAPAPSSSGYIPMADGTQLHYELWLPSGNGPFPVALDYDPYVGGSPYNVYVQSGWLAAGYALLGVNMRGTGCSSGTLDVINTPQWGQDGAQVIAWAAQQPWSTGAVGMFGASFPGITQLGTAAFAGAALRAIAPFATWSDLYRSPAFPGGIYNASSVTGAFLLAQPQYSAAAASAGGAGCADNAAQWQKSNPPLNLATTLPMHPFEDSFYATDVSAYVGNIQVPVLGCTTWQDTELGSRVAELFLGQLNPATTWFVGSNGQHTQCATPPGLLVQFFDHFVKGLDNHFEATPHVLLAHEVSSLDPQIASPALNQSGAAAWTTSLNNWTDGVLPLALHLQANGTLLAAPASASSTSAPVMYQFPSATINTPSAWNGAANQNGQVSFTTPALPNDVEILGPANAALWMSSTGADTDVQVTISEVRPDGQEMYVQNGWLRLSQRALSAALSMPLRPYQTHLRSDVASLVPGVPAYVQIEIFPFNHVFRQGSAIRLTIDTPSQLEVLDGTATNAVYFDRQHDSNLTLGYLVAGSAQAPLSPCASTAGQPCRTNARGLPAGTFAMSAPVVDVTVTPATISFGQATTLAWSASEVTACTASGSWSGAVVTGGSTTGPPPAPGTYTYDLSCSGPLGSASGSATLTVNPASSSGSGGGSSSGGSSSGGSSSGGSSSGGSSGGGSSGGSSRSSSGGTASGGGGAADPGTLIGLILLAMVRRWAPRWHCRM